MPSMTGTFKLIRSDNFDEYLKAVGVGILMRKVFITASPSTHITNEEDEWTITIPYEKYPKPLLQCSSSFTTMCNTISVSSAITTSRNHNTTTEIKFKLREEFDETTADGRFCRSVITQEGENKLIHVQNCAGGPSSTIIREFADTEMKMTLRGPGYVASTFIYERQ